MTTLVRSAVAGGLVAAAVAFASVVLATANPPQVGSSFYVVRPDPRLCPSPLCGGYWVALANRARTRCHDGLLRPRCYVARAVDEDRHPLTATLPDGALARAAIESGAFEGLGQLGVLVVADVYAPAGGAPPSGRFVRLVDTGIRCIRAPCFSIRAAWLNRSSRTTLSGLESLGVVSEWLVFRVETALATKNGVLAQGRIVATIDGGREFQATRFFLRSTS